MKKIITALTLFDKKVPNTEVTAIERTLSNWFKVTTANYDEYLVSIANNSVEPFLDDPEY